MMFLGSSRREGGEKNDSVVDSSDLSWSNKHFSSKETAKTALLRSLRRRRILEQLQTGKLTEFMDPVTILRVTVNISPVAGLYII